MSGGDVFGIAHATQTASLQTLFKIPTPTVVFETATIPSHFAHLWQGAESIALATEK